MNLNILKTGLLAAGTMLVLSFTAVGAQETDSAAEQRPDTVENHPNKEAFHRKHFDGPHHQRGDMAMKKVDTNDDGQVDLSEFLANAEQRFQTMDLDGNGYVTSQEMKEAGKLMRDKHHEAKQKHHEAMQEAHKAYKDKIQESD